MERQRGWVAVAAAGCLTLVVVSAAVLRAQEPSSRLPTETITAIRINSGQSVTPYFEGWIRNADGTFDMVFGYFNRNYQQEFAIPAGPNNRVEPGQPDQGQPTYFLPRRQRYVYRVRVPADFGKNSGLTDNQPFHVHVLVPGEGEKATKVKLMEFKNAPGKKADQAFIHSTIGMRYTTIFVKNIDAANLRMIAYGTMPLGKGVVEIPDGRFLGLYRDPDGNFVELVGPRVTK